MRQDVRVRISVLGLFWQSEAILMIHKLNGPEPDRWDLPGGGLQAGEPLLQGLKREVHEETGLRDFQIEKLLTISEDFFPDWKGQLLHSLSIIYHCSTLEREGLRSLDFLEVGEKGVQWMPVSQLTPEICSTRSWKAIQAAELFRTNA